MAKTSGQTIITLVYKQKSKRVGRNATTLTLQQLLEECSAGFPQLVGEKFIVQYNGELAVRPSRD